MFIIIKWGIDLHGNHTQLVDKKNLQVTSNFVIAFVTAKAMPKSFDSWISNSLKQLPYFFRGR